MMYTSHSVMEGLSELVLGQIINHYEVNNDEDSNNDLLYSH